MTAPRRVQLSRKKGWRKPENAVVVARPSRWGNPFRLSREDCTESNDAGVCWVVRHGDRRTGYTHSDTAEEARGEAVALFREWLAVGRLSYGRGEVRAQLRGKNLACWCPIGEPCHADVLLEIANAP